MNEHFNYSFYQLESPFKEKNFSYNEKLNKTKIKSLSLNNLTTRSETSKNKLLLIIIFII